MKITKDCTKNGTGTVHIDYIRRNIRFPTISVMVRYWLAGCFIVLYGSVLVHVPGHYLLSFAYIKLFYIIKAIHDEHSRGEESVSCCYLKMSQFWIPNTHESLIVSEKLHTLYIYRTFSIFIFKYYICYRNWTLFFSLFKKKKKKKKQARK